MPILRTVHRDTFAACVDFLKEREHRCISLTSHLAKDGVPSFPADKVRHLVYFAESGEAAIDGVLLVTTTSILLHCFRENTDPKPYAPLIAHFLSRTKVRCIIGCQTDSLFLETIIGSEPFRAVDYQLMTLESERSIPVKGDVSSRDDTSSDDTSHDSVINIRQADLDDLEQISPLQEGYEKEEVIPPGDLFDPEVMKALLKKSIETQCIYVAVANGKIIAKAGTNALGLDWDQIGGVYTLPEWRNRGLASSLVQRTARERMNKGRKIALFVKLTNIPAQKAYEKSGFHNDIFFRISYF